MQKTSEWLLSFNTQYEKQIQSLLHEKRSHKSKTKTISITGGKGGVGKTSISLKFAKELAHSGYKVLLIDCDYNLANTAIKLGLPVTNNFFSLLSAEKTFEESLYTDGNFHLLSACNGNINLFDGLFRLEEFIIDIISEHKSHYDFVLLDCPAGLMRETLILNAYCDDRIMVVTPDKSSITDSYSMMKILCHKFGIKFNHLLINMYNNEKQFEKVVKTLSETVENFLGCRTYILGGLPKAEIDHSRFDSFFLSDRENIIHRNFLKVVSRYTDQMGTSLCEREFSLHTSEGLEQEVQ